MTPLFRRSSTDAAFERLYRRHVTEVYRYAYAVLGEQADAEDVTQTTFLNAYRAYCRGERPEKAQNWLITIAHNVCRQRFRQAKRRPEVALEHVETVVAPEREGPSAEELRRAFGQLPPSQREALVMRELEGRSYAEIATVMGISQSALETLIFRARRTLREQLEEQLTCDEAAFALSQQADGRLSAAGKRSLRAHLRACPECARAAQRDRAIRGALKGILTVPLPPSLASFFGGAAGSTAAASAVGGAGLKAIAVLAAGAVAAGSGTVAVKRHEAKSAAAPARAATKAVAAAPVVVATPAVLVAAPARAKTHARVTHASRHRARPAAKPKQAPRSLPHAKHEPVTPVDSGPPESKHEPAGPRHEPAQPKHQPAEPKHEPKRPDAPPGREKQAAAAEHTPPRARPSTPPGQARKAEAHADAVPPPQAGEPADAASDNADPGSHGKGPAPEAADPGPPAQLPVLTLPLPQPPGPPADKGQPPRSDRGPGRR